MGGLERPNGKIWPRLDELRTMSLLKLQRGALNVVIAIVTGHCIMSTHASRFGLRHLANDFFRSYRDEEEEDTVPQLLGTCSTLCQKRKKYLGANYMDDLEKLSRIDIGNLNRFIRSSEWF